MSLLNNIQQPTPCDFALDKERIFQKILRNR